jgi:hypothetical protein
MTATATIQINQTVYTLEVETAISNNTDVLEVEAISSQTLEISTGYVGDVVFASDVIGLDNYLSDFIDTYNIDCGTP